MSNSQQELTNLQKSQHQLKAIKEMKIKEKEFLLIKKQIETNIQKQKLLIQQQQNEKSKLKANIQELNDKFNKPQTKIKTFQLLQAKYEKENKKSL